ncbi:MAG: hypothetical protein U9N13_05910 [Euryarchaeota archaeon]|nr:hypothetical protein [Euryarchaeota archaeon]
MDEKVRINEKGYSLDTLGLVTGDRNQGSDISGVAQEYLLLCEVIDDPYALPYLLDRFNSMELPDPEAFRLSLIRIQVDSDLRINEDMEKHQHRAYVSRTIEKLLFSDVLLEIVRELDFTVDEE